MNSKVIQSDIEINTNIIVKILHEQFNIYTQQIKLLGEGWDNTVYLVNNHLVFRFPRREEAIALIEREMLILPKLQKKIDLEIPKPIFLGKPSQTFIRPFYGHELIIGRSGCSIKLTHKEYEQLALDLAHFLKKLHCINPKDLCLNQDLDPAFDRIEAKTLIKQLHRRLLEIKKHYNLSRYIGNIDTIINKALRYNSKGIKVFVHGDLYHRHLLFNDRHILTGIIDWGDCCVSDPVEDLAVVFQFLPKVYHALFFSEYGEIDEDTMDYAKFLGLYYAIALLWYGHDRNDHDLIKTSLWTFEELL